MVTFQQKGPTTQNTNTRNKNVTRTGKKNSKKIKRKLPPKARIRALLPMKAKHWQRNSKILKPKTNFLFNTTTMQ